MIFAEFLYNNTTSSTLKMTPFFANYGFYPRAELEPDPSRPALGNPDLSGEAAALSRLDAYLRHEMSYAQDLQKEFANRKRSPAPVFKPGDQVWLFTRHIRTTRPSRKIDWQKLGRFTIRRRVGTHAYELVLPDTMRIHPVFHVSLLEPCHSM